MIDAVGPEPCRPDDVERLGAVVPQRVGNQGDLSARQLHDRSPSVEISHRFVELQRRSTVKSPGQHGRAGASDILDDAFACRRLKRIWSLDRARATRKAERWVTPF